MRTILFKGKRNDNDEWVEGSYHKHISVTPSPMSKPKDEDIKYLILVDGFSDWGMPRDIDVIEVDPSTVCQYIGRDDKNGKMVFGGDILKRIDRENEEFTVVYDDVYCRFMLVNSIGDEIPINSPHIRSFYEIIGNIHD